MKYDLDFSSNSKEFWIRYAKKFKAETRKGMRAAGKQIWQKARQLAPSGPRTKKQMAKYGRTYREQRAEYGRLQTSIRGRFVKVGYKARQRSGTFVRYKISYLGWRKKPRPSAYWGNFIVAGTTSRSTKSGANRGRIKKNPFLEKAINPHKRSMGPVVAVAAKKAKSEAKRARMEKHA